MKDAVAPLKTNVKVACAAVWKRIKVFARAPVNSGS